MEDLAVAHAEVAGLSEALRQRHHVWHRVAQVCDQVHDAVPVGPHAREERGARWRAVRDAGVRTREERAACGKGIDVRRMCGAVAVRSEVWPQVVNYEQQDVWAGCGGGGGRGGGGRRVVRRCGVRLEAPPRGVARRAALIRDSLRPAQIDATGWSTI